MKKKDVRSMGILGIVISSLVILSIVAVGGILRNGHENAETITPTPSPSPTIDAAALAQCRVDAVMLYMEGQGFSDDGYVIGEDRIDWDAPAIREAGQAAFGEPPTSRDELAEAFESDDPKILAAVQYQKDMFPSFVRSGAFMDVNNWEPVQALEESQIPNNTGYVSEVVVNMGTRLNKEGDGGWVFIDPETCTAPTAEVLPPGHTGEPPIGFIRFGCFNPGDGLIPPPEPPPELNPKSDDKEDYRRPGDDGKGDDVGTGTKPKALVTPVESSPPKVDTGKGDEKPGDETSGQAPGADPPPANAPPPPTNEGGEDTNEGEVGGF